jgi:hypothetical protein
MDGDHQERLDRDPDQQDEEEVRAAEGTVEHGRHVEQHFLTIGHHTRFLDTLQACRAPTHA